MKTSPALEHLSKFFSNVKAKHFSEILEDLFTPKEIDELAERLHILKQLEKGKPQRQIAKDLGISVTTVNRGSKVLQKGKQKIKKYL